MSDTSKQSVLFTISATNAISRTNAVLDRYNQELFGPRGLFCMIMSYEPEAYDELKSQSSQSLSSQLSRFGSLASGSWVRNPVSGKSQGAHNLPTAVAPLMFIDDRRQHKELLSDGCSLESTEKVKSSKRAKRAFDTFNDYLDRRARAQYVSLAVCFLSARQRFEMAA